jgi:hypothetical protein
MKKICLPKPFQPISIIGIIAWYTIFCTITLFFLCVNQSCKKSFPPQLTLPPITEQGYNTFGCKVDGRIWIPNAKCNFFTDPCRAIFVSVIPANNINKLPVGISISAANISGAGSTHFHLVSKYISNPPATYISMPGNIFDSLDIEYLTGNVTIYHVSPFKPGAVEINKLDALNGIVSGTFAFNLYDAYGDSVVVSDGRFDLLFSVCKCFN